MEFRDMTIAQVEAQLVALDKKVADLQSALDAANRRLADSGATVVDVPEPLKEYDSWDDVPHPPERWPDEPATWRRPEFQQIAMQMQAGLFSKDYMEKGFHLPYRNIIVAGKEYRVIGGRTNTDEVLICNRRCPDVEAKVLWGQVQAGDDSYESDEADIIRFLKEDFTGKAVRKPLSMWREDYQQYAEVLAEARPDLIQEWESRLYSRYHTGTPAG